MKGILKFSLLLLIATFFGSAKQENGVEVKVFNHEVSPGNPDTINMAELNNIKIGTKILTVNQDGKPLWVKSFTYILDQAIPRESNICTKCTDFINEEFLKHIKQLQPGDHIMCSDIVYMTPDHKEVKLKPVRILRVTN